MRAFVHEPMKTRSMRDVHERRPRREVHVAERALDRLALAPDRRTRPDRERRRRPARPCRGSSPTSPAASAHRCRRRPWRRTPRRRRCAARATRRARAPSRRRSARPAVPRDTRTSCRRARSSPRARRPRSTCCRSSCGPPSRARARLAGVLDHVARAAGDAEPPDRGEHHVLRRDAERQVAFEARRPSSSAAPAAASASPARARPPTCRCRRRARRTRRASRCGCRRRRSSCPGCVSPSSGPITCTIPSRPLPVANSRTPNSSQLRRSASSWALRERVGDRPVDRRHVVIHRRDRQVGAPHRPARRGAAPRTPAGSSPRARDAGRRRAAPARRLARRRRARPRPCGRACARSACRAPRRSDPKRRSSRVSSRSSHERRAHAPVEHVAVEHHVEAVAPRRVRERARDELHEVDVVARRAARAHGRARPGWWSVTKESAVRQPSPPATCVYGAIATKRVNAPGWSPTSSAITCEPVLVGGLGARDRDVRRVAGSETSRAASAVVADGHALDVPVGEQVAALVERGRVRPQRPSRPPTFEPGRPSRQWTDRQRHLAHDRERRLVEQVVRLGDRADERALDRQHAELDLRGRRPPRSPPMKLGRPIEREASGTSTAAAAPLWLPGGPG